MIAHVLRGSKQEIAAHLAQLTGEVREAIVFVEEPKALEPPRVDAPDIFAEMQTFMVDVQVLDDSRAAVYSRMDGE